MVECLGHYNRVNYDCCSGYENVLKFDVKYEISRVCCSVQICEGFKNL